MTIEISIVIPNWNGMPYLEKCLNSLKNQDFSGYEVIVVDNGSTDGSVEFIRNHFPKTRVVSFDENKGFSRAVNAGIRRAKGRYILLLNNDVIVDPDFLSEIMEVGQYEVGIGALNPVIYYMEEARNNVIWSAGGKTNMWLAACGNRGRDSP